MSGSDPAIESAAPPSFEAGLSRLSEIVCALEKGDLTLEESLALFEEGVKLSRITQQRLDAAEQRVEQLLAVDAQGRAETTPFEANAPATPSGAASPPSQQPQRPMASR